MEDREYWIKTHNTKIMKRISMLLEDIVMSRLNEDLSVVSKAYV